MKVHLSNLDINARATNVTNYLADKPGVGRGSMWGTDQLET